MAQIENGKDYLQALADAFCAMPHVKGFRDSKYVPDNYYGSTIATVVYEMDYTTIGTVISQLFELFEGISGIKLEVDGHNALEELLVEMTCVSFRLDQILIDDNGGCGVDLIKLHELIDRYAFLGNTQKEN